MSGNKFEFEEPLPPGLPPEAAIRLLEEGIWRGLAENVRAAAMQWAFSAVARRALERVLSVMNKQLLKLASEERSGSQWKQ